MATLDPWQKEKVMRAGLRRIAWLAVLVAVTAVAAWIADGSLAGPERMWSAWEGVDITGYQAAWTTLSIAGVWAVYWWGVGSGSRYEPPPMSALRTIEMVAPAPDSASPKPD